MSYARSSRPDMERLSPVAYRLPPPEASSGRRLPRAPLVIDARATQTERGWPENLGERVPHILTHPVYPAGTRFSLISFTIRKLSRKIRL